MRLGLYIAAAMLSEVGEQELENGPGNTLYLFWMCGHGLKFGDGRGEGDKK